MTKRMEAIGKKLLARWVRLLRWSWERDATQRDRGSLVRSLIISFFPYRFLFLSLPFRFHRFHRWKRVCMQLSFNLEPHIAVCSGHTRLQPLNPSCIGPTENFTIQLVHLNKNA